MRSVSVILLCVAAASAQRHFMELRHRELPPPTPDHSKVVSGEQFFTQPVDQFDGANADTFRQRYWYNDGLCRDTSSCPVFLYLSGESTADPGWLTSGQWYEMAQIHGAYMYVLEHRYYGDSYPVNQFTDENMRYLTSEQALADMASFIQQMNTDMGFTGPWITFGGSYAGSLSAWARQKYPDLVWGAVSSSGPLNAKLDFWEYYETCFDALGTTDNGAECQAVYQEAFETAEQMLQDPDTARELYLTMQVCDPGSIEDELDVWSFGQYFNGLIGGTVQYNGFYSYTIDDICNTLTDPLNGNTALERYSKLVDQIYGAGCFTISYEGFLESSLSVMNPEIHGIWRQWYFQTCNEFGWYQTSNIPSGYQGTLNMHPVELDEQYCIDAYGSTFTSSSLDANMEDTNGYYGGKTPTDDISNLVYVHGSIDPWHQMGIWEADLNANAPHIYIQGSSHCADMYQSNRITSPELEEARAQIKDLVASWIANYN